MKKNKVTPGQANEVRQMANAKGVTREQFQAALSDGRLALFLRSLTLSLRIVDVFCGEASLSGSTFISRAKMVSAGNSGLEAYEYCMDPANRLKIPEKVKALVFPDTESGNGDNRTVYWILHSDNKCYGERRQVEGTFNFGCWVAVVEPA